jgi:serine/threonine-protein kinase
MAGDPLPDELVGHDIDHFHVEALLGAGGMGAVYRATDRRLGRQVALKTLAGVPSPTLAARFEREARALSALAHPNIAQILWLGSYQGRPYFAMELIAGPTFLELIERPVSADRTLSLGNCLRYLEEAAEGLGYAHQHHIVHRDIKPSNLMLDEHGRVKIVDFGLARNLLDDHTITQHAVALGTPRYMAPEVALGGGSDHRADVYSLGATFYHLLAGEPPFEADSALSLMLHQVHTPLTPLRLRNPRVTTGVARLVEGMLAKEPSARPADYEALLLQIRRLRGTLATDSPGASRPVVPAREPAGLYQPPTLAATPSALGKARPTAQPADGARTNPVALALVGMCVLALALAVAGNLRQDRAPTAAATPAGSPMADSEPAAQEPNVSRPADPPASAPDRVAPPQGPRVLLLGLAQRTQTLGVLRRATTMVEVYLADRNQPPPSLSEATDGEPFVDAWGAPIAYRLTGGYGYELSSNGPDGLADTADDIRLPPFGQGR